MSATLDTPTDMRTYLRPLRFGLPLGLVLAIAAAATAWTLTPPTTPEYLSVAKVLVGQGIIEGPARARGTTDVVTESELVRSDEVAARVVELLEWDPDVEAALAAMEVVTTRDSQVLSLRFTADTPEHAQDGAGAFAGAYLNVREERLTAPIEARTRDLQRQLADLREDLAQANEIVDASEPGTSEARTAEANRDLIATQVQVVTGSLMEMEAVEVDPGRVIQPPRAPTDPVVSPDGSRRTIAIVAAALALALALVVAYSMAGLSDRVTSVRDIEMELMAPVMGAVGRIGRSRRLPILTHPHRGVAESVRHLREAVVAALARSGTRGVVVCEVGGAGVSSTIAANLAAAVAMTGRSVLVLSADGRETSVEVALGATTGPTLADVLGPQVATPPEVPDSAVRGLAVVRRGPAGDVALFERADTADRLAAMVDSVDLLLVVSGRATSADTIAATRALGAVVLVVPRRARRRDLAVAHRRLSTVDAHVLGVAVAEGWRRLSWGAGRPVVRLPSVVGEPQSVQAAADPS